MARIEESVEIERPVESVFAYTTEAKYWPRWQSIIVEAEQTSQGPMHIGATYKGITRMLGLSVKWTATVTEYEANRTWAKSIACGSMVIGEHVTYAPIEGRMKFAIVYEIEVGGFLKLFAPMMLSSMRKETKRSLGDLKSILETPA